MPFKTSIYDLATIYKEEEARRPHTDLGEKAHIQVHSIDLRHRLHSFKSSEPFIEQVSADSGIPFLVDS